MPTSGLRISVLCALSTLGCASAMHVSGAPPASDYLETPDGEGTTDVHVGRLRRSVCASEALRQEFRPVTAADFVKFLRAQGLETTLSTVRPDLVYVDVPNAATGEPLRFRVATLEDADVAGRDLHLALLQHGAGWWGLHRSNLAVLGTSGSEEDIVAFAARTRLVCWGVLTIAGVDDTFVVPGGYLEL